MPWKDRDREIPWTSSLLINLLFSKSFVFFHRRDRPETITQKLYMEDSNVMVKAMEKQRKPFQIFPNRPQTIPQLLPNSSQAIPQPFPNIPQLFQNY